MTFNVHLAQFDVAPTRTRAGISLICDYLINGLNKKYSNLIISRCKIAKYVTSH